MADKPGDWMRCYDCRITVMSRATKLTCPHCNGDQFDTVGLTVKQRWHCDDVVPVLEPEVVMAIAARMMRG